MTAGRATCALPGCPRTVASKGRRADGTQKVSRYCRQHSSPETRELLRLGTEYVLDLGHGPVRGTVKLVEPWTVDRVHTFIISFQEVENPARLWRITPWEFGYSLERGIHKNAHS